MISKTRSRHRARTPKFEETFIPDGSARLARTHRIIRIEKGREIQFMKLCCQIRLDDTKQIRGDGQREDRKLKRVKHNRTVTSD